MKNYKVNNSNFLMRVFINSNVQMINNFIVYNLMVIYYDFGVYFKIFRKFGFDNGFYVKDYMYGKNGGGYIN